MYDEFIKIIDKNNGIITTKEAEKNGISRMNLKKMTDSGKIKRLEHGVYVTDKFVYDELYLFQMKHNNIVFSYNTALYLHGMTERTPNKMDITTKRNINYSTYRNKINLYRVNEELLKLGTCELTTPYGNKVIAYNLERTVCDIINNKSNIDLEVVNKAIRSCVNSQNFSASKMFEYSKKMKIYDKVKIYMEAII